MKEKKPASNPLCLVHGERCIILCLVQSVLVGVPFSHLHVFKSYLFSLWSNATFSIKLLLIHFNMEITSSLQITKAHSFTTLIGADLIPPCIVAMLVYASPAPIMSCKLLDAGIMYNLPFYHHCLAQCRNSSWLTKWINDWMNELTNTNQDLFSIKWYSKHTYQWK